MKRQLQFYDNHYEWNYWEPFGPWDVDPVKKTTAHWVGINPNAGYQSREVAQIVDAYHHGIVFDENDIKRLINTNLEVMWNKDKSNPGFANSNIAHGGQREYQGKPTGTLWTSLIDFDQRIRDLYEIRFKDKSEQSEEYLYYKNFVANTPPGFKRKYAKQNVTLPEVPFSECREINMAVVIPGVIKKGTKSVIINDSRKAGQMEIALYSADSKTKLKSLYNGSSRSIFMIEWDGTDPDKKDNYKGDYRIRWTMGNEYREYPVNIR
jgi:hypothetical protein